jgi:3-hydroxybutyryl-CoA dehydrogenase
VAPQPLTRDATIGVLGAGAMGGGIAQVAAAHGHRVVLADAAPEAAERARSQIEKALDREVEKGRLDRGAAAATLARIELARPVGAIVGFRDCALVIEAIVERLDAKRDAFAALEGAVGAECLLATNTSSLSIAAIGSACRRPERVVGAHFFNPPTLMPLVEIVPGVATAPAVREAVRTLVEGWGKTTVVAADTPGFVVNRIARPYYGEALRLLEEGAADASTIDWAMKELGGFRMGPFELMDFIGHDVNFAVTRSVWEAFFYDPRYRPSFAQQRLVEAGRLGKKAGLGFYDWRDGAARPEPRRDPDAGRAIVDRIVAMLINEAVDALLLGVASAADIDLAMTKGVNYPRGLLAWADDLGAGVVLSRLEALQAEYGEDRYRPSPLLRRRARDGGRFLA